MDERVTAHRNSHMRRSPGDGRKENKIARLLSSQAYLIAFPVLIPGFSRQPDADAGKHVLREAAAVETTQVRPAVSIRYASQRQSGVDDCRR